MKKHVLVALVVLTCSGTNSARAEENFFSRFNPFRTFQWENRQTGTTSEQRLAELRSRLEERGIDSSTIDQRIASMQAARAGGNVRREKRTTDDIRARLEARGLDTAEIDSRIERITAARESGQRPERLLQGGNISEEDIRTRLEERDLDAETIDERIERFKSRLEEGNANPARFRNRAGRFRGR